MKEIVAIKSENGSYFVIGKNESGYYLKNKYTEIPNEFNMYSEAEVKKLFDDLCERIPDCVKVGFVTGHPNSCLRAVYSDKTEQLFREQKGIGKNLAAFTYGAASFSEFFSGRISGRSELITLDHLRWVCREKSENYKVLLKAVRDYIEDDYVSVFEVLKPDGTTEIRKMIYSVDHGAIITITADGSIGETGELGFVELMKQHDVSICR